MQWISCLQNSPVLFLICTGILGLIIGSFLNVVILRVPVMLQREWRMQCDSYIEENRAFFPEATLTESQNSSHTNHVTSFNLFTPASHCPTCKHQLSALENIPLLSFLILKGRCRQCKQPISWRYPLIEVLTAILSVCVAAHFHFSIVTLYALILTWSLLVLTVIDLEHLLLPDDITLSILWLGLIINIQGIFTSLPHAVLGAVFGYLFLWSVYWIFKLVTHKEGMGYGDFKLLAMLGAWLGWSHLPSIVLISSISGAICGIVFIVIKQQHRSTPIPFGPFLAAGGWVTLMWGDKITQIYLKFAHLS